MKDFGKLPQQLNLHQPSPLSQLKHPLLAQNELNLLLKRDDLLHPEIGGNKFRKLKYNLAEAIQTQARRLATFGGAYSNHIAALAAAGKFFNIATTGIIRGEEHLPLNPTLLKAKADGMELLYLNRDLYRQKSEPEIMDFYTRMLGPGVYFLPEGGSNLLAVKGCAEMVGELNDTHWTHLCCPVGTGGSIAGAIAGSGGMGTILGFPALKGGDFLKPEIDNLQRSFSGLSHCNWSLITDYHFGGYAKIKPELLRFMKDFNDQHSIQLDPIYTGKMMFGIFDLVGKGYFPKGSTIIAWHTGGLQGLAGMRDKGVDV